MKKHILMLLDATFPTDIRVEKEMNALIAEGFQLSIICHYETNKPVEEKWNNVYIYRYVNINNSLVKAINAFIANLIFRNFLFIKAIKKVAKKKHIHFIHVHDLPLVNTAIILRKKLAIKVIFDCHENFPEALQAWHKWNIFSLKNSIKQYIFGYKRWLNYEKRALEKSDASIVVVKEMKERMMSLHHIPADKLTVVSNTEPKSFNKNEINSNIINVAKDEFIVSYIGGFGPHRGIDTAIEALSYIDNSNITLLLIGQGSKDVELKINTLISNLSLEKRIKKLPWQPFHTVPSFVAISNLCLVPHHKNPHTSNTIPHKLFQYMSFGKPVITSDCESLSSVINDTKAGLVFEAGNSKDLAEKISALYYDKKLYDTCSKNGVYATQEGKYNWETESKKLITLYKQLSQQ